MELATITADKNEARKAFLEYRAAVRERHDEEDAQIMKGYRELAKGTQLLRLTDTLTAGGTTDLRVTANRWNSRTARTERFQTDVAVPRLAVARADVKQVWTFGIDGEGACVFQMAKTISERNNKDRHRVPKGTFRPGDRDEWAGWRGPRIRAIVPNVPPPLRPAHHLRNYLVLFEAEWKVSAPPAPVDPALLKHIGGDLYAVVAVWDLTDLEQAVLAGRAES